MENYEILGSFYLGKTVDPATKQRQPDYLLYDANDLTTHAMCVGMTGSGKTGLCIDILEEAAMDGIPAIVIDPKGDIADRMLTFPDLAPDDFLPWIDPSAAERAGTTPEAYATSQAKLWRDGLAKWDQGPDRIARLRERAAIDIYTPGSTSVRPISILDVFGLPTDAIRNDPEAFNEHAGNSADSLLGLLGLDTDPIRSRERILLVQILLTLWTSGQSPDLAALIQLIQRPPIEQVGVLDLETFYPAKERFAFAMQVNNLLASPRFLSWSQGEPLDIDRLLYTETGRPRTAILSIAHLSDSDRMFFVSLLLNRLVSWMRSQPGTSSLRALFYMDEIFGYFPPVANPPSKAPLMTLLKQARAFGLGIMLTTQNPKDLDYKGLSNIGTWFIGRLQTDRDRDRLIEGLSGTDSPADDRRRMEELIAGLGKRIFLMRNVHDDGPVLFESRWCMSYLAGPLTRDQLKHLVSTASSQAVEEKTAEMPRSATGPTGVEEVQKPDTELAGAVEEVREAATESADTVEEMPRSATGPTGATGSKPSFAGTDHVEAPVVPGPQSQVNELQAPVQQAPAQQAPVQQPAAQQPAAQQAPVQQPAAQQPAAQQALAQQPAAQQWPAGPWPAQRYSQWPAPAYPQAPGYPPVPSYPQGQGYPQAPGYPQTPGYPQVLGYSQGRGYPQIPGYPQAQGYPQIPGYPPIQGYPQAPGYPPVQGYPLTQPYPAAPGPTTVSIPGTTYPTAPTATAGSPAPTAPTATAGSPAPTAPTATAGSPAPTAPQAPTSDSFPTPASAPDSSAKASVPVTISTASAPAQHPASEPISVSEPPIATASVPTPAPARTPTSPMTPPPGASILPVLPADIPQYVLPATGQPDHYEPALLGVVDVIFDDTKIGLNAQRREILTTPLTNDLIKVDWSASTRRSFDLDALQTDILPGATVAALSPTASKKSSYTAWGRDLIDFVYRNATCELFHNATLKAYSQPGEDERAFRIRIGQLAREARDTELEKVRRSYASKVRTAQNKVTRAEQALEREQQQVSNAKTQTAISFGSTLLGAFMGRSVVSRTNVNKAASAMKGVSRTKQQAGDVERAKETLANAKDDLAKLEELIKQDLAQIEVTYAQTAEEIETVELKPLKKNCMMRTLSLVWVPFAGSADLTNGSAAER